MERTFNWKEYTGRVPWRHTPEDRNRRDLLFRNFDLNGNAFLALSEVDKAFRDALKVPELFPSKAIITKAFTACRAAAPETSRLSAEFIERGEFRLILEAAVRFLDLLAAADASDAEDDCLVTLEGFLDLVSVVDVWFEGDVDATPPQVDAILRDPTGYYASIDAADSGAVSLVELAHHILVSSIVWDADASSGVVGALAPALATTTRRPSAVRLVVRIKLLSDAARAQSQAVLTAEGHNLMVSPRDARDGLWFRCDALLGELAPARHVHDATAAHLVDAVVNGHNACLCVLGSAGTGKTHTIFGGGQEPGVLGLMARALMSQLDASPPHLAHTVAVGYFEVDDAGVIDLLADAPAARTSASSARDGHILPGATAAAAASMDGRRLHPRRAAIGQPLDVPGLTERYCTSANEILATVNDGSAARLDIAAARGGVRWHGFIRIRVETVDVRRPEFVLTRQLLIVHSKGAARVKGNPAATGARVAQIGAVNESTSLLTAALVHSADYRRRVARLRAEKAARDSRIAARKSAAITATGGAATTGTLSPTAGSAGALVTSGGGTPSRRQPVASATQGFGVGVGVGSGAGTVSLPSLSLSGGRGMRVAAATRRMAYDDGARMCGPGDALDAHVIIPRLRGAVGHVEVFAPQRGRAVDPESEDRFQTESRESGAFFGGCPYTTLLAGPLGGKWETSVVVCVDQSDYLATVDSIERAQPLLTVPSRLSYEVRQTDIGRVTQQLIDERASADAVVRQSALLTAIKRATERMNRSLDLGTTKVGVGADATVLAPAGKAATVHPAARTAAAAAREAALAKQAWHTNTMKAPVDLSFRQQRIARAARVAVAAQATGLVALPTGGADDGDHVLKLEDQPTPTYADGCPLTDIAARVQQLQAEFEAIRNGDDAVAAPLSYTDRLLARATLPAPLPPPPGPPREWRQNEQRALRHGNLHTVYIPSSTGVKHTYTGLWAAGKRSGFGTHVTKLHKYEGEWEDGLHHGGGSLFVRLDVHGTIAANNAAAKAAEDDEGSLVNHDRRNRLSRAEGMGVAVDEARTLAGSKEVASAKGLWRRVYAGEWWRGRRHGFGTAWGDDGAVYEGEFRDDVPHGIGRLFLPDGSVIEGEFANGKASGWARSYAPVPMPNPYAAADPPERSIYEGRWLDGKRHGVGRLIFPISRRVMTGVWEHGTCRCSEIVDVAQKETVDEAAGSRFVARCELVDPDGVLAEAIDVVRQRNLAAGTPLDERPLPDMVGLGGTLALEGGGAYPQIAMKGDDDDDVAAQLPLTPGRG